MEGTGPPVEGGKVIVKLRLAVGSSLGILGKKERWGGKLDHRGARAGRGTVRGQREGQGESENDEGEKRTYEGLVEKKG